METADEPGPPVVADESFENAAPAPLPERLPDGGANQATAEPAPAVAAMAEKVPAGTRSLLAELFKAEITSVRRISRDQLR